VATLEYTLEPEELVAASARLTPMTSRGRTEASNTRLLMVVLFACGGFLLADNRLGGGLASTVVAALVSCAAGLLGWLVSPAIWSLRLRRSSKRQARGLAGPIHYRLATEASGLRVAIDGSSGLVGWSDIGGVIEEEAFALLLLRPDEGFLLIPKHDQVDEVAQLLNEVRSGQGQSAAGPDS